MHELSWTALAVVALPLLGCADQTLAPTSTVAYDGSSTTALVDVYRPFRADGLVPTVVFVHGGGFELGSRRDGEKYARSLCAKGIEVVSLDYRFASEAAWPAPLADVRAALRYVRANARELGSSGRIGVLGASAGACLASIAALAEDPIDGRRPECLVSISGYGDLRLGPTRSMADFDRIIGAELGHALPFSDEELGSLSPALYARPDVRALLVHSMWDANVYVEQSDALAAALSRDGAGLSYLRRAGFAHGDDLWLEDGAAREAVASFLLATLR